MDLTDPNNLRRYQRARESSDARLNPFRQSRRAVIEKYVGSEYGEAARDSRRRRTIVTLMQDFVGTFSLMLAGGRPACDITTDHPELDAFARKYKAMVNFSLDEMDAETTFFRIVQDAIFGIGIGKVYFAPGNIVQVRNPTMPPEPSMHDGPEVWQRYRQLQQLVPENILVDAGKPFFERISIDDFSFDMSASSWETVEWMAHDYRLPFDQVRDDDRYPLELRKQLAPDSKFSQMDGGTLKAKTISTANSDVDELRDKITLTDVYLPQFQCWYTVVKKNKTLPPLYHEEWRCPLAGPFIPLTFHDVPDNIMPISKAGALAPLHDFVNQLYRKTIRQAVNQKSVGLFQGNPADAKRITNADDMEWVHQQNPNGANVVAFNGPDKGIIAVTQFLENEFSKRGMNMDVNAGLGAQTPTARQEQIVKDSSNVQVDLLKNRTAKFATKVMKNLAWMIWMDQVKSQQIPVQYQGVSVPLLSKWTQAERDGDFLDYNFKVDPYSLPYKAPTNKLDECDRFLQKMAPFAQLMMQLGILPNFQQMVEDNADLLDNPRIRRMFIFGSQPVAPPDGPIGQPPGFEMSLPQDEGSGVGRYIKQTQSTPQEMANQTTQSLLAGAGQGS